MKLFAFITIAFALTSCNNSFKLQEGDLLFQDIDCGPMCEAIEAVTQGVDNYNFSHIALVIESNDTLFALEAISAGVVLTPINEFLERSADSAGNPKVLVGRLKKEHQHLNKGAIEYAMNQLGTAYDDEFIMNNDKYYCSELLYDAYKQANSNRAVFLLYPMTFKPLDSEEFFPVWGDYYKNMEMDIPQGEPGINPGGISQSEYITIVFKYGEISTK